MTEDTPTPTVPRAIVCPVEDCAVLIPDTVEDQRRHRRGHEHRVKVDDAIRRGLRGLSGRIDTLSGATKDDVRQMKDLVAGIERLVKGIEIPEQQPQMEIARPTGWDDGEDDRDEEDETAAAIEDDWASLTEPAEPEPDLIPETEDATAGEPAESGADVIDDDAEPAVVGAEAVRAAWIAR